MRLNPTRLLPVLLLSGSIVALSGQNAARAEIHQWTDDQGRIHFSDRPPGSTRSAVPSRRQDTKPRSPDRADERRRLLNYYDEKRRRKKEDLAKEQEKKRKYRQACTVARDELKQFKSGRFRWYDTNDQGEKQYLDNQQLDQELSRRQARVKKYCK